MSLVKGFPAPVWPVNDDEFAPVSFARRFDNDYVLRNLALERMGVSVPRAVKTGTTIVACVFDGGVVMGADSRATAGNIVADKHCVKLEKVTECIYACGAGTAADMDQVIRMLWANMRLYELNNPGRRAEVKMCAHRAKQHLFRYQGHVGAWLLVGGVDHTGPSLIDVSAHGSVRRGPYGADGSGSLAAMTVLERDYTMGMSASAARDLVQRALEAGMHADQASGNTLRMAVITKEGAEHIGPIAPAFAKRPDENELSYAFAAGASLVLHTGERKFDVLRTVVVGGGEEKEETAVGEGGDSAMEVA